DVCPLRPNDLRILVQPDEGVRLSFLVKRPGAGMVMQHSVLGFDYADLGTGPTPDAYQRLLLDAINGNPTLFIRGDEVEAAWAFVDGIRASWDDLPVHTYPAGSWGPTEADELFRGCEGTWSQARAPREPHARRDHRRRGRGGGRGGGRGAGDPRGRRGARSLPAGAVRGVVAGAGARVARRAPRRRAARAHVRDLGRRASPAHGRGRRGRRLASAARAEQPPPGLGALVLAAGRAADHGPHGATGLAARGGGRLRRGLHALDRAPRRGAPGRRTRRSHRVALSRAPGARGRRRVRGRGRQPQAAAAAAEPDPARAAGRGPRHPRGHRDREGRDAEGRPRRPRVASPRSLSTRGLVALGARPGRRRPAPPTKGRHMSTADLAVIGLGVMGANLARNFHSRGLTVAVYNRNAAVADAFHAAHGDARFIDCRDYAALAAALRRPRKVLLMVTAGPAVDAVIEELRSHLEPDDVIIDGGNSHWPDTERRHEALAPTGLRFMGMGVSGGEEGALHGPSMMPGGDRASWERLRPLVERAAAVSDSGPCVTWCGQRSAGHAVKMVHNGIEYGDMQLIAETWSLLRAGLSRSPVQLREVFERWNEGRLQSFLVEITAQIVAAADPQGEGPLVDAILDVAGQKGTGRWTTIDAVQSGVPLSTITAAVDARALSARHEDRQRAATVFAEEPGPLPGITEADLEAALYAAKLMSYTQGFDLLRTASRERDYQTDLAEVARIWKAGCIIRARFLDRVHAAYRSDPELPLLCLDPSFAQELRAALPAWRRVVSAAVSAGHPVPALTASLGWFDAMRQARGSAALLQAQRDFFGAHTYRRIDAPDVAVHTEWSELAQLRSP
ncbi:MAG: NADP-dependent phosphogluconate dehydrogenase, partial [Myxococcales bacterium]|nr:NADP-dependent phosphogluconate dehydrogenase [Myxococcales bacterium]